MWQILKKHATKNFEGFTEMSPCHALKEFRIYLGDTEQKDMKSKMTTIDINNRHNNRWETREQSTIKVLQTRIPYKN